MKQARVLGLLLVAAMLGVPGCAAQPEPAPELVLDGGGVTMDQAAMQSLEEQYAAAGQRYVELNELMAELQREHFVDEWQDGGLSAEVVPMGGQGFFPRMSDANNDNSYAFRMRRAHPVSVDIEAYILSVADEWRARGWDVTVHEPFLRYSRVTTLTPEGYWLSAGESDDLFRLTASSPAYWGEFDPLAAAVVERRDVEYAANVPGAVMERVDGFAWLTPGTYRPFPAWDALEKYPPVSDEKP